MRNLLYLLLIVIFQISAVHASNVTGYGKSKWGMTPEQVISTESGRAHKISPPEKFSGALGLVRIDSVDIARNNFAVTYLFSNNSLIQVNVSSHEQKNNLINNRAFGSIESLLTQKYGKPTYRNDGKNAVWNLDGTSIEINNFYIPDINSQIIIRYTPSSVTKKDTSNL